MNQETIERAARAIRDTVRISIRPDGGTMELLEHGHTFHLNPDEANTAARAVIAAIHPTVSSVEELDALPDGAAVLDNEGGVAEKYEDEWYFLGGPPLTSSTLASFGKLTVLYTPGGAA